jgi:hypothetical protein
MQDVDRRHLEALIIDLGISASSSEREASILPDWPVVDAVGLLSAGTTLLVILALRGSLIRPAMWSHCDEAQGL